MWLVVVDNAASNSEREAAFDTLLRLQEGWWGFGTLPRFVRSVARVAARRHLLRVGCAVDQLDWEQLSNEALLLVFEKRETDVRDPRAWLVGVIWNLVKQEARRNRHYLGAARLTDRMLRRGGTSAAASEPARNPSASGDSTETLAWLRPTVKDKVLGLGPSLRKVAELLCEGYSSPEIAQTLGISAATLRKRQQRMRAALAPDLAATLGIAAPQIPPTSMASLAPDRGLGTFRRGFPSDATEA